MKIDLSKMSRDELLSLQNDVEQALEDWAVRQREEARQAAEDAVKQFGFTLADITNAKRGKAKAGKSTSVAKYANPENATETWSGRGRQPGWFKAALENGKTPEELAI